MEQSPADSSPTRPHAQPSRWQMERFVESAARSNAMFDLGVDRGLHLVRDSESLRAVDVAIHIGNLPALEQLLAIGCPLDAEPGFPSPLAHACDAGDSRMVKFLIAAGQDVNFGGLDPLGRPSRTPLMLACACLCSTPLECVELLLNAGAEPDLADDEGRDARHFASRRGHAYVELFDRAFAEREARSLSQAALPAPARQGARL